MTACVTEFAVINDPTGIHARPAVKLSKLAKKFEACVRLSATDGKDWIDAKSINSVMKMKAAGGTKLIVKATGSDAHAAAAALIALIQRNFEEC